MSSNDASPDPVDWLRAQIRLEREIAYQAQGLLGIKHPWFTEKDLHWTDEKPGLPRGKAQHIAWNDPDSRMADCDAKLAIIDRCQPLLSPDPEDLDEDYQDGRDPDERERDEALADLADDILALLADGYRHRPGWADHWACPGCGKPMHEVPDGHAWAISMQDGTWSCSDPSPVAPTPDLFIAAAPAPGGRFQVFVPLGCDSLGEMPPPAGHGFTMDLNKDRWRALVSSATGDMDSGWTVEFEIEGRYPEDEEGGS